MTVVAPDDPVASDAATQAPAEPRWWHHRWIVPAALALTVGAMAALMLATHRPGHWWGDDWALYLRQAQSLLDGNPSEVTADNHFTVEQSRGTPGG